MHLDRREDIFRCVTIVSMLVAVGVLREKGWFRILSDGSPLPGGIGNFATPDSQSNHARHSGDVNQIDNLTSRDFACKASYAALERLRNNKPVET